MSKIFEKEINTSDVKAIFRAAEDERNNNQGFWRNALRFKKDSVDANDLLQAWKEDGFPDDIRDIERILQDHGFGKKEIHNALSRVFGVDGDTYQSPNDSATIKKIADYAKANGLADALVHFLEKEYGLPDARMYEGKLVVEQVRDIFDNIIKEKRTLRPELIEQFEQANLGRNKK